ncbi:hypothetical protein [Verrucosispora sp. NA02020]|uniref:hypothetical protein n=1 Tax=Verrucosispora sp. NA02020 TaxID=2742132 RepID=UPI0015912524|nr:hypothetical protein [Verrucosispora sp. NA02020]QKW15382.1 hypothetical protein HUT12_23190 [Verrucosispora sp. NA02020]
MPENDRLGGGRRAARTTPNRTPYVWVEDDSTGHRYDVLETALRPGMTPVEGYDKNYTGRPRHPKHRTDLSGQNSRAAGVTTAGDTDADTPAADAPTKTSPKGAQR